MSKTNTTGNKTIDDATKKDAREPRAHTGADETAHEPRARDTEGDDAPIAYSVNVAVADPLSGDFISVVSQVVCDLEPDDEPYRDFEDLDGHIAYNTIHYPRSVSDERERAHLSKLARDLRTHAVIFFLVGTSPDFFDRYAVNEKKLALVLARVSQLTGGKASLLSLASIASNGKSATRDN